MTVYVGTFLLVFLFGTLAQTYSGGSDVLVCGRECQPKRSRNFYILAALVLIFVAGCRYNVGADYGGYSDGYQTYSQDLVRGLLELDEPGIRFIYWLTTLVWDDGAACIFAIAAVTLGLELHAVYKNTDQLLFSLLLFTLMVWDACFNGVRQALATAVLCCGLRFLREGKFWPYLIVVAVAYLCHKSSVIMLAVYPVCRREVNGRNWLILIIASVIVLFSMDKIFAFTGWLLNDSTDVSSYYNNSYWTSSINRWRTAAYIAPAIFFGACYWRKDKTEEETFYLNLVLIHALVAVMTMNSTCLGRVSIYTSPYLVIAIPQLLKRFERADRQLLSIGIVTLYIFFCWYENKGATWHWIWNR